MGHKREVDVVIVGAGPAGIGTALALKQVGIDAVILDAGRVGASFLGWPAEMRLITPSFHSNPFLQPDLNAIQPDTSPADLLGVEHLSGEQYAAYLQAVVDYYLLWVREYEKVTGIEPVDSGFVVHREGADPLAARQVIWAGGEFQRPRIPAIPGVANGLHTASVEAWADVEGDDFVIVGGYESGIDAAYHLGMRGKRVTVLSTDEPWQRDDPDPSVSLSPYTRERLLQLIDEHGERIRLIGDAEVVAVHPDDEGFAIETRGGERYTTPCPPYFATGFHSALEPVKALFAWENDQPRFTENDESTLHPGLYYAGPSLVHRDSKFCFIYKFRARFGVIARTIADRLGRAHDGLQHYAARGFLIDDLACCVDCRCALTEKENSETASTTP